MLLLSLTARYRAIQRDFSLRKVPRGRLDAQARFACQMAQSLSLPELQLCLAQIRGQLRRNLNERRLCLHSLLVWSVVGVIWALVFPMLGWLGMLVPMAHLAGFWRLVRVQTDLLAIERCLCLLGMF